LHYYCLVDGKTVEVSSTASSHQVFLTATTGAMGAIPGIGVLAATGAVKVTHLGCTLSVRTAGPVVARMIGAVIDGSTVKCGPGKDVVLVRGVATTIDYATVLVERSLFA